MVGQRQEKNKELAAELVCKAIATLNEEKGSTLRTIRNHIGNEYKIPPDIIKNLIIPSLENGIQFGVIVQNMGRYHLSDLIEKIVNLARKRKSKKSDHEPCEDKRICRNCQNHNKNRKTKPKSDKKGGKRVKQKSDYQREGELESPCDETSESDYEE